jgi:hypothetical protein
VIVPFPSLLFVKKPLTKCPQGAIIKHVKNLLGGVAMQRLDGLLELAPEVGIEVKPAGKRGEVILIFPRKNGEPFTLRLSREKASQLILWMYIYTERPKDYSKEIMPWEETQKGGESHG